MVRATFRILSQARADSPSSSIAEVSIEICSFVNWQNFLICELVIAAFTRSVRPYGAKRRFCISLAASTLLRISAEDSPFEAFARSLTGRAEASTWMSILSSSGPETLAL